MARDRQPESPFPSSRATADRCGLAGATTDPGAFVNGLSAAFIVNAALALIAAALAATTIASGHG